jgi:hypothetical protein
MGGRIAGEAGTLLHSILFSLQGDGFAEFTRRAANVLNMMGFLVTLLTMFRWTKVPSQTRNSLSSPKDFDVMSRWL